MRGLRPLIRRAWEELQFWALLAVLLLYLIPLLLACRILGIRLDD